MLKGINHCWYVNMASRRVVFLSDGQMRNGGYGGAVWGSGRFWWGSPIYASMKSDSSWKGWICWVVAWENWSSSICSWFGCSGTWFPVLMLFSSLNLSFEPRDPQCLWVKVRRRWSCWSWWFWRGVVCGSISTDNTCLSVIFILSSKKIRTNLWVNQYFGEQFNIWSWGKVNWTHLYWDSDKMSH